LPDAALNSAYEQSLVATGGTPPYNWTVQSSPPSSLPAGLTLSPDGVLSGTPTAEGSYSSTLTVADSGSPQKSASQLFSTAIGTMPDISQMAMLELFVLRHTWLTDPAASGDNANGGLYGLPDDDLSTVNSLVATTAQQLAQVQSQASTYSDGFAYLNAKNAALQTLNTQLRSRVAPASWQTLSDYMTNALTRTSSQSLDSNAQVMTTVAPKTCNAAATTCEYMWSEINFFNGGGSNHGLGTRLDSFVQGANARDFTSQVKNFVLKLCQLNQGCSTVATWDDRSGPGGRSAAATWTVADPQRGTYVVTGNHAFQYRSQNAAPPFTSLLNGEAQPPYGSWNFNKGDGLDTHQTQVDLGFKIGSSTFLGQFGPVYDVYSCSSPIVVAAALVPPLPAGNQAPTLSWSGGTPVNNLTRSVPCQVGNVTLSVALGANLTSTMTVSVHASPTVSLEPATATGKPLDVLTFTAHGSPAASPSTFHWSTDNMNILQFVDDNCTSGSTCVGSPSRSFRCDSQVDCVQRVQILQPGDAHVTVQYATAQASSPQQSALVSATGYYKLSGQVTAGNKGFKGAILTMRGDPAGAQTTTTSSDGKYTFFVRAGYNISLGISAAPYTFQFNASNDTTPPRCVSHPTSSNPQGCYFYNVQSSLVQDFTAPPFTTVFLLHGISQKSEDIANFARNLTSATSGLDLSRYVIDAGFDFSECGAKVSCTVSKYGDACGISAGGKSLARYISQQAPAGDFVLVGYSMGGLIARDFLANTATNAAYVNVLDGTHHIAGLITLGSPVLGYAYETIDNQFKCPPIAQDMTGYWNPSDPTVPGTLSPYLQGIKNVWNSSLYGNTWVAAAGTFCSNPYRSIVVGDDLSKGCRFGSGADGRSDGVVCRDSAVYSANSSPPPPGAPFYREYPSYSHTRALEGVGTWLVLGCTTMTSNPSLSDPQPLQNDGLFEDIVSTLNNLPRN
jgi:pimeloyl-ACP methyl ester carboxylesterase